MEEAQVGVGVGAEAEVGVEVGVFQESEAEAGAGAGVDQPHGVGVEVQSETLKGGRGGRSATEETFLLPEFDLSMTTMTLDILSRLGVPSILRSSLQAQQPVLVD